MNKLFVIALLLSAAEVARADGNKDLDAIALPGGNGSDDPAKLAAASVWFIDTSPSARCANGAQKHVLHRYQFDRGQRLAKSNDKAYCGSPPSGAYR